MTLVLASASPRRKELLARIVDWFEILPVDIEEEVGAGHDVRIIARRIARDKAEAARLLAPDSAIIAADTIVWLDGRPLGKPAEPDDAREMLRELRGRAHMVVSAVAVIPVGHTAILAREPVTTVTLRHYTDEDIEDTIRRGEPFDKAGGYAIQDPVLAPVESWDGCYCNVVGLSLIATMDLMERAGLMPTRIPDLLPQCSSCPLTLR
jgi:MAF protein